MIPRVREAMTRGNLILDSDYPIKGLTMVLFVKAARILIWDSRSPFYVDLRTWSRIRVDGGGSQSDVTLSERTLLWIL